MRYTREQFVCFVNDFGAVYNGTHVGLTDEDVIRYDDRVIFEIRVPTFGGVVRLDFDRTKVETVIEKAQALLSSTSEELAAAFNSAQRP